MLVWFHETGTQRWHRFRTGEEAMPRSVGEINQWHYLYRIHWVIVGGGSGRDATLMDLTSTGRYIRRPTRWSGWAQDRWGRAAASWLSDRRIPADENRCIIQYKVQVPDPELSLLSDTNSNNGNNHASTL